MACEARCDGGNLTPSFVHCVGAPLIRAACRPMQEAGQPASVDDELIDEGIKTMAYERPTLTKVGDFQKVTGLAGTGSPDLLGGHSLL
ncbi:hypothetical protein SUDANB96_00083 [Streptomyces sp. enrichment culture]